MRKFVGAIMNLFLEQNLKIEPKQNLIVQVEYVYAHFIADQYSLLDVLHPSKNVLYALWI